jgi:predicted glycogen debranching enzyme
LISLPADAAAEWLESDGSGGFASGPVRGARTRRYHAVLLCATTPPTGRMVLVNGFEAWAGDVALNTQRYTPDVTFPDGDAYLDVFVTDPWPTWQFTLPDGTQITHEIFVQPDSCETVLRWRRTRGEGACSLRVRLLISGRDYHALHHENPGFRFDAEISGGNLCWRPYPGVPAITALTNGSYSHAPEWYRGFLYAAERDRGLDDTEDLASPGVFAFDLGGGEAAIILRAGDGGAGAAAPYAEALAARGRVRRAGASSRLALAARSYVVARPGGKTIIAGFPWFTDWGRDTFISMRGLLLALGELEGAEAILLAWSGCVSEGMLPNRFPDRGETPEYNAVDASLWFIIAADAFLGASAAAGRQVAATVQDALAAACQSILEGYTAGTRFGIQADADGLLRAGIPGVQLTWMDAKTGDHVVTPRIGKPVEIQALWINALYIAGDRWGPKWRLAAMRAQDAFARRFKNPEGGLFDVIDDGHVPGSTDASLRPNQIFAVGGLPMPLLGGSVASGIVDLVEARLLTPLGLRTLSPDDPAYVGRYRGGPAARDGAYHQGTVWPWLMGAFVDAWLTVRGRTEAAKAEAAARFLPPLMAHLDEAGLGHVSEVADGDAPHVPGGCPFQAWSLGELIRVRRMCGLTV